MNVLFIGLGAIGLPMAEQILKAGHSVAGVDVFESARQRAEVAGIKAYAAYDQASHSDLVVVMVATPAQLAELVALRLKTESAKPSIWVVMSTVGPESVVEMGDILRSAGERVVDAPVTGGVARAKTGNLVIFASGTPADLDAVAPVLSALGRVEQVGEQLGQGQSIKVVNQHLCSIHIVAAAEAMNLAKNLGLDPASVLKLVEGGAGGSWMLSDRGPRIVADGNVEVTSTVDIFVKDSGLVVEAAKAYGAAVPLLSIAHQRYKQASESGFGRADDSQVIRTWDQ
ncbi:NAD(P)-dependent oxidoreductase [Pseudomonas tolaasii]